MAAANTVSDLQAVDFGFGRVLVAAYEGLAPRGPAAFQRFLSRDNATKIFRADNEDLRTLLIRIAGKVSNGNALPDLPVIAYYRSPGLSGSDEKPRSYDLTRYSDGGTTKIKLTAVPVEISYSIAFCAWDKPTLDSLTIAWWAYIGQFGRRHSRFTVRYPLGDGKPDMEVKAFLTATRDIATDSASTDQGDGRLWAARTLAMVKTQVLYYRESPRNLRTLPVYRVNHITPCIITIYSKRYVMINPGRNLISATSKRELSLKPCP